MSHWFCDIILYFTAEQKQEEDEDEEEGEGEEECGGVEVLLWTQ